MSRSVIWSKKPIGAREILENRRADLESGAKLLMTKETLTADEFAPLQSLERQLPKAAA